MLRSRQRQFKEITYGYFDGLYRLAYARLSNAEDAEDVVQETFCKAFRAFDSFREGSNSKAWLVRILVNTIRDHIRKDSRTLQAVPLDEAIHAPISRHPSPEDQLTENELDPELQAALQSLPESFLSPFLLRELHGLSYQEIANVLDVPIGTVMSRLSRARDMLRKKLAVSSEFAPNRKPIENSTCDKPFTTP